MNDSDVTNGAIRRQLAFPFAGWIMIAVIMLFAASGGGPTQLRAIGSAFDPLTTAVALNPKQRPLAAKPAILDAGLPEAVTGSSPLPATAAYEAGASTLLRILPWRAARSMASGRSRLRAVPLGARAPPHH